MTRTSGARPLTLAARERLRDQQRLEVARLDAVIAAERRVAAERERADKVIAKAEHAVAEKQVALRETVVALVETSGLARAALLLGRTENGLARLVRERRRGDTSERPTGPVPA